MKYIDLCAGTGAFSLVLSQYGQCVFANDIEPASKIIYKSNFPNHNFVLNDMHKLDEEKIPDHDIICCGFSCQPYSQAGNRQGFEDPRSDIFWKLLDIMKYHMPKLVIMENVKGLLSHNSGETYKLMKKSIKKIGYKIISKIVDTGLHTHIPQHRERIYIICLLEYDFDIDNINLNFPIIEQDEITEFLEKIIPDKYYYTEESKIYDKLQSANIKHIDTNTMYQYRRHFVRENKSKKCPCLTANMGTGGHNVPILKDDIGIRKLTPRECFNFQGFPSTYILPQSLSNSKLYKLAGNAVSVHIVELIIKEILINHID